MTSRLRTTLLTCSLLLVVLQIVVYAPALNHAFVHYDDNTYVYENKNVKTLNAETTAAMFARPYFRSYTPLALLSHAIDYAFWKEKPWGHHLTSLLLHSINVVLVFILGAVLLSKRSPGGTGPGRGGLFSSVDAGALAGACIAAALYSVHPIRVESVAWVSDRKDLLLALFLVPSVLAYLKYDEQRGTGAAAKWFVVALVFNLLALLSKTIATVTPLLLLSLDGLLLHRGARRTEWTNLLLEKIPFFFMSAGFGLLAMWAAHGSLPNDLVARMTTAQRIFLPLYTLAFYPVKYLLPTGLTPIYTTPATAWMAAGALLALFIVAAALREARRGHVGWLLALAGYALPLLPVLSGISAGIQPWADRYTYVPSIALFLIAGEGVAILWRRTTVRLRTATVAAAAIVALCFVLMDRQQIGIWKDSETLWRAAVREAPAIPNTYDNLGVALADKGDFDGALEMYRTAIRLRPDYADPYYNAAVIFQSREMRDSAFIYYSRAIASDAECIDAYINLANMLANEGNREAATMLYERALTLDADNADVYYNLGCVVYQNGDRDKALDCFKKAITFSPGYAKAYYNMGIVFLDLNRKEAALESFVRAARLGSSDAQDRLTHAGYSWN